MKDTLEKLLKVAELIKCTNEISEITQLLECEEDSKLLVAVIGEFKTCKSSLVNRLLYPGIIEHDLQLNSTAIPIYYEYGKELSLSVSPYEKDQEKYDQDELSVSLQYTFSDKQKIVYNNPDIHVIKSLTSSDINEEQNQIASSYARANVFLPNDLLRGITIVDTPGINSQNASLTQITCNLLPDVDIGIFCSSFRQLSNFEVQFIKKHFGNKTNIGLLICINFDSDFHTINSAENLRVTITSQLKNLGLENFYIDFFDVNEIHQNLSTNIHNLTLEGCQLNSMCNPYHNRQDINDIWNSPKDFIKRMADLITYFAAYKKQQNQNQKLRDVYRRISEMIKANEIYLQKNKLIDFKHSNSFIQYKQKVLIDLFHLEKWLFEHLQFTQLIIHKQLRLRLHEYLQNYCHGLVSCKNLQEIRSKSLFNGNFSFDGLQDVINEIEAYAMTSIIKLDSLFVEKLDSIFLEYLGVRSSELELSVFSGISGYKHDEKSIIDLKDFKFDFMNLLLTLLQPFELIIPKALGAQILHLYAEQIFEASFNKTSPVLEEQLHATYQELDKKVLDNINRIKLEVLKMLNYSMSDLKKYGLIYTNARQELAKIQIPECEEREISLNSE